MNETDRFSDIQEQVAHARGESSRLIVRGGASKSFLGCPLPDTVSELSLAGYAGIVEYDPAELVVTARAGTNLRELQGLLRDAGQMLPFEPPAYADSATLGGTIACNLSGPGRAYQGAARDYVLGVKMINGRGQLLSFGGQVMKNVAGYDVSRLLTGSCGSLGALLEISMKVLPVHAASCTLVQSVAADEAIEYLNQLSTVDYPLTATSYDGLNVYVRLQGAESAVQAARKRLGGDELAAGDEYWEKLREHKHRFFQSDKTLWRLSVDSAASSQPFAGKWLYEWGGSLRWYIGSAAGEQIRDFARKNGGHAVQFRNPRSESSIFHPLSPALNKIHQKIKRVFDPDFVFWSPGFMAELYK